jgi:hypothetical protein
LEVQDVCLPVRCDDNTLKGTNLEKFGELLLEGSLKLGVGLDVALTTKQLMEEAGFVDVVQVIYKWPLNRWPANKTMKEIGTLLSSRAEQPACSRSWALKLSLIRSLGARGHVEQPSRVRCDIHQWSWLVDRGAGRFPCRC